MQIIKNNTQLSNALMDMLQGVAFWMGYSKCMNEVYEHDCVHQAFAILRSNLGKEKYTLKYEYNYSDIDKSIKTQERADLVILKNTPKRKTPVCVLEFKMSDNTNGGVESDVIKLKQIKKAGIYKFVILLFYDDNPKLRSIYTIGKGNDLRAKPTPVNFDKSDCSVRVRRVAKAMATANKPKRSPYMSICIEV